MNPEQELAVLKDRNRRVEADKAWEASGTRILIISCTTYMIAGVTLWFIGVTKPWITALIPTLGFYLSTLTLAPVKHWWMKKRLPSD